MKGFEIGQEVETSVVQISSDTVFIDLGLKSEGFLHIPTNRAQSVMLRSLGSLSK